MSRKTIAAAALALGLVLTGCTSGADKVSENGEDLVELRAVKVVDA